MEKQIRRGKYNNLKIETWSFKSVLLKTITIEIAVGMQSIQIQSVVSV